MSQDRKAARSPAGPAAGIVTRLREGGGWKLLLAGAGLVAATLLCYAPVFRAGFVWDDDMMLTGNPFVKAPAGLYYIWFSTGLPDYFPLTSSSLWVEWRLWGMNATGYHLTNVLLHALSALMIWRVLKRLEVRGAWLAALVFAVHPVNVESVAWIAERKNTLALVFFLICLLCYLRHENRDTVEGSSKSATPDGGAGPREETGNAPRTTQARSGDDPQTSGITGHKWYWISLLAFLCALLSKTSVVMLPFVLLLCAWWQRGWVTRRDLFRSGPFFVLSLALGLVTVWFQYQRAIAGEAVQTSDFWTRLAAAGWAVWFYLFKALLPLHLSFVYPRWEIDSHSVISYLPALGLALVLGIGWRYRRGWGRAVLYALGYFVLMLLPVLGFLNIYFQRYSLVADHWQYFSIISPIALVAGAASLQVGAWGSKALRAGAGLGAGVCLACLAALSWRQAGSYANSETLWLDTLARNPRAWMAHNNLGQVRASQGRYEEAMAQYAAALRIKPDQMEAHNNLGSVLLEQGRIEEAAAHFQAALQVNPGFAMAWYNLGNLADTRGDRGKAMALYRHALRLRPVYPEAHNNLACLLAKEGSLQEARWHFGEALRFRPDYADAYNNLASLLIEQGSPAEAAAYLEKGLELNPDCAEAHYNLGNARFKLGRTGDAAAEYARALQLKPGLAEPHYKLGNICLKQGNQGEALDHFLAALKSRPDFAEVHYQLGMLRKARKEWAEGVKHLQEAVRLKPEWGEALNNLAWLYATQTDAQFRDGPEAERLAARAVALSGTNSAGVLDTLAAAQAEAGRFAQAVQTAQQAVEAARAAGQTNLAKQIEIRLELYRQQLPYRE